VFALHRRRLLLGACLLAAILAFVSGAGALEPPKELNTVCVDKRANVFQAADGSFCGRDEQVFRLPQDGPFRMCAELRAGNLRHVTGSGGCTSKERPVTVPDSGPVYVCSGNIQGGTLLNRGPLRRVDDPGQCDPRGETAYVTPAAPQPVADGYSTGEDTLLDVPARGVLVNDKDLTGAPLTARLVSGVTRGSLAFRTDGSFAFDPRAVFDGLDEGEKGFETFSYLANDGALDSAPATVTVTIVGRNDAPVATADGYSTSEDDVLRVPARGVLANDTDAEDHPLTAVLVSGVSRGHLALNPDGSFAYDPGGAFEGLDSGESAVVSFTYLTRDGTADSAATRATITVTGRNDAPEPAADAYSTDENTVLRIGAPGVLGNDEDAEDQGLRAVPEGGPSAGDLTLRDDGSFDFDPRIAFDGLQTGQTGTATFTYRAVDAGGAASAPAQVTISVSGRSAPALIDDRRTTDEDTPIQIAVLANDATNGGTITHVAATLGTAGAPDAAGVITYTPGAAFQDLPHGATREGSFTYTVTNDEGASTATVRVDVSGRNDAPVAVADGYEAAEDATLVTTAADGVLANDADVDDGPLTAVLVSPPSKGRLALAPDGSFEFQPAGDLTDGQTDSVTFAYRASDGRAESDTVTATIRVNGVNDPPVVLDQAFFADEGSAAGSSVGTVAFSDPDAGQDHSFAIVSGNGGGAFAIDSQTGALTVARPELLDAETTPFFDLVVRVTDDGGLSDTARVRISIRDVDETPIAADDDYPATGNTQLVAGGATPGTGAFRLDGRSLLANDRDPDGGALTAVAVSGETSPAGAGAARGRYSVAADGSFTYDPPRGFTGTDSFTYTVTDGVEQATATVRLTVADRVWYVDGSRALPGDGTSAAPYSSAGSIAAGDATDDDAPGDTLFMFTGTGSYAAAVTLEDRQRLIGHGADLVVDGATLATRATAPNLSSTGAPAVTLATGNELRGLTVAASGAAGVQGSSFGTLAAALDAVSSTGAPALDLTNGTAQVAIGSLSSSDSSGAGLHLDRLGGTLSVTTATLARSASPAIESLDSAAVVTLSGGSIDSAAGGVLASGGAGRLDVATSITTTGGHSVEIAQLEAPSGTGCSVAVRGPVTDSGAGVLVHDNAGAARACFTGRLALQTGASPAFTARDGGTLSVVGDANTIATTTGRGLDLRAIGIGSDGATFRSVSSDGAAEAITVRSLRAGGGRLAVAGSGSPDTGGIIRAATTGVSISDASNVLLSGLRVTQSSAHGIALARTSGLAIRQTVVEDSGGSGVRGEDVAELSLGGNLLVQRNDGQGVELHNALGSSTLTQATLRSNRGSSQLLVSNTRATAAAPAAPADSLRVDSTIFESGPATAVDVQAGTGSNLRVQVGDPDGGTSNFVRDGVTGVRGRASAGGRLDLDVTKLFRQNGRGDAVSLEAGGASASGDAARLTFAVIDNNPTRGGLISAPGGAGVRLQAATGGVLEGAVLGNQIDQPGDDGIAILSTGGRVEPDVGSNQVFRPGCRIPGTFDTRCGDTTTAPEACATVPEADSDIAGVSVTSGGGGTVAGRIRRNEIDDPLGGGILTRVSGPAAADTSTVAATLELSGNRVTQTLGCSLRSTPLLATAVGGRMTLTGGGNTLTVTNPARDALAIDASASAAVSTALAGDRIEGGRHGVAATATSAGLDVDLSQTRRTGGDGDGVRLRAAGPGAVLNYEIRDAAAANGGGISSPAGAGVSVTGDGTALIAGTVSGNDISEPGGAGVDISGRLAGVVVDGNRITGARESAIAVDGRAPSLSDTPPLALRVNGNVVHDAGAKATDPLPFPPPSPLPPDSYDAIAVRTERPGTAELRDNAVTGTVHGGGIAVTGVGVPLDLILAGNEAGSASAPLAGTGPGVAVTAAGSGSMLCLDLIGNASFVSGGHSGYRLQSAGAPGTFDLKDYDFTGVGSWAAGRGNTGTVEPNGAFGSC
jgi:VCBS repeat-containing protein